MNAKTKYRKLQLSDTQIKMILEGSDIPMDEAIAWELKEIVGKGLSL
jgi:hypothetical protein